MSQRRSADIDENLDDLDLIAETEYETSSSEFLYKNGNGVLIFNEKLYAAGLTWLTAQEFEEDGSVYKKAQAISADFYCTRSFIEQNGFGTLKLKHKMGMPSAAAMAADALIGEWHGVFVADNGWLYVAVHSDTIAPEGDLFFLSEEEAYNHFIHEAENYKWPKTYVPEAWNVKTNDGEIGLDKIVEDVESTTLKPANLNAFFGSAANKSLALISLCIAVGFILLLMFSQSLMTSIVPQRAEAPSQQLNISDALSVPPKEPIFRKDPLEALLETKSLPTPSKMIGACIENFDQLMVSIPGWDINQMRCRGNLVEAIWQRGVGNLETLRNNVDQFPFGISRTYGANGNFLASRIIPGTASFNEGLRLSTRGNALTRIDNRFGSLGNLGVRDIAPKTEQVDPRRGARQQNETEEDAFKPITLDDLPSLGVTLKTDVSPKEILNNFNYPGLKLNLIEWNIRNGNWLYDMQVYLYPEDYLPNQN